VRPPIRFVHNRGVLAGVLAAAAGCAPAPPPARVEIPPRVAETVAPPPSASAAPRTPEARCDAGEASACDDIAERCVSTSPQDLPRAHALLLRSCNDLGDARGCYQLGDLYLVGIGVTADFGRAHALFDQACDHRYGRACKALGTLYIEGIVAHDYQPDPRGAVYMRRGCESGDAEACLFYGDFLEQGRGVARDHEKAVTYFHRACEKGDSRGCDAAAGRH
jgi:TPR repeat protein